MKKIILMAAAAIALASCSSESELAQLPTADNGQVAVAFDAPYLSTTRATVINNSNFKEFGVYAYEQGTIGWDTYRSSNVYPNFFYNQKVEKSGENWTYSPVKYFSNNLGAKHSFFAYAPYNPSNNAIFSMANNAPVIRYTAKENCDLLWAPAIIDQEKPGVSSKLSFHFQHALSKVTFDVAPFVDAVHGSGSHTDGTVATGTTVTVRSVKFTGKVPSQGLLNLRDGSWTIEATEEGAYEITNPVSFSATDNSRKNLISNMMVIPTTGVKIKVVYDVTTIDNDNPKNNSTVTNTVESEETFDLTKGKAYTFHLDLGLTTVKFVADVDNWGDDSSSNVDLPNNYNMLTAAMNYTYNDYTYKATLSISGNEVTAQYATTEEATANLTNDMARFLGALYRGAHVQSITYNSKNFRWDASLNLLGSNYRESAYVGKTDDTDAHKHTLVSQITAPSAGTSITLICDGVELKFKYTVSA